MPIDDCVPGQRLKSIRSFIALAVLGRRRRRRRCERNIVFFFLYHFTNLVCIYIIIIYYTHRFHGPAVSVDKTLARYIFSVKLEQIRFLEWNRAVVVYRMHIITYRYLHSVEASPTASISVRSRNHVFNGNFNSHENAATTK